MKCIVMNRMSELVLSLGYALSLLAVLFVLTGCSNEPASVDEKGSQESSTSIEMPREPEFNSILPREAFALLEQEKNIVVIDVRTAAEREQVRIPDSVAVPLGDIMRGQAELPGDKPLLLVCAVGGRSYAAGLYLIKEKYRRVYNLRGGIVAWEKAGLPLEYGNR